MSVFAGPFEVVAVENLEVVRFGLLSLPQIRPDVIADMRLLSAVHELDLEARPPHVLVLDYWLGHENEPVVHDLPRLCRWAPRVVLYTSEERPARLQEAIRSGVSGLCLKTDGLVALADTIRDVWTRGSAFSGPLAAALLDHDTLGAHLTPRECDVLEGLAMGMSIAEIAQHLVLSEKTVQTHAENIRRKYTADGSRANRARLVLEAQRDGYVDPPQPREPLP